MMGPPTPEFHALLARVDLTLLYPPFADLYAATIQACLARGVPYYCISGLRSWDEQAALYAKGRRKEKDGTWTVADESAIVTKAKPGSSAHQFGVAADSCLDKDADRAGLQPGWRLADYEVLAEEAEKVGLESALRWKRFREGPHLQLPLRTRGVNLSKLRNLYERGGMAAVWKHLDGYDWRKRP